MKIVSKNIVLGVSMWMLSMGPSLWASSTEFPEELPERSESSLPAFPPQKEALNFSFQIRVPFMAEEREIILDEPAPILPSGNPPTEEELAWREALIAKASSSKSADAEKSPKSRKKPINKTHSIKESKGSSDERSPKNGRRRAGSGVKKDEPVAAFLSASSSVTHDEITFQPPAKVTYLKEDENKDPVIGVTFAVPLKGAPEKLTQEQIRELLGIPLKRKIIEIGFNSTVAGDVATKKVELEGGLASHKLTALGVQRISHILDTHPDAIAKLDSDEKRNDHTVKDQGYEYGFLGYYDLHLPSGKKISESRFRIAIALK
ncbi:MAG: hypothetical protein J0H12_07355 [Candidatus Paracaedimonas acanthamoebae]|uniref:OmpA-like domain-containing protein n=1 Tax=Candidatus Paracaedimonas acanthamoebae TaxID=244581 RepID=A0A8J7PK42_9PROT|nr:hypothetical protein [Candidatus Paracaedimonas acanthamoebae]